MERLPYIDTHDREIAATRSEVWAALLAALRKDLGGAQPAAFVRTWRLEPASRRGRWNGVVERGDSLPGFAVADVTAPARLAFAGRHRFSGYSLTISLTETSRGRTLVSAETRAVFPGLLGRGYRAIVIGTRMHRVMVRRLLRSVEGQL